MIKFKKLILIFIMTFILILIGNTKTYSSSSELSLENLDFTVQINNDGSMDVIETWDIDIENTNTLYKTFKIDKTKYTSIENVNVADITNQSQQSFTETYTWAYHLSKGRFFGGINNDGKYEIAFGIGMDNSSGKRRYRIQYTVKDVITKYDDYAQLYWQFIGSDFEIPARKVTGTIYLPEKANSTEEIKVWGHIESLNGEIYATDLNTIQFQVIGYNPGRYMEIRTLFPTDMITYSGRTENTTIYDVAVVEETIWANEANAKREREKNMKTIVSLIVVVCSLIITYRFFKNYLKYKKEKDEMPEKLKPFQKLEYYREFPREDATPAEARYILNENEGEFLGTDIGPIFSATILDLSLKKYIKLNVDPTKREKESISIEILKNSDIDLENYKDEKEILEFLKGILIKDKDKKITIKELLKYIKQNTSKIIALKSKIDENINKSLINKEIINKEEKEKIKKYNYETVKYIIVISILPIITVALIALNFMLYVLIGLIPLFIISIINCFKVNSIEKNINIYSQKGIDESEMWKGLKRYMENFSMLDKREVPELVIWEKYLVYATAFGIADKVLKQLKIVYPNIEEMTGIENYAYMSLMINTNFSSNFSNAISTSISSSYSSGTGGGGGFSGGGGGGRWPAEVEEEDKTSSCFLL